MSGAISWLGYEGGLLTLETGGWHPSPPLLGHAPPPPLYWPLILAQMNWILSLWFPGLFDFQLCQFLSDLDEILPQYPRAMAVCRRETSPESNRPFQSFSAKNF